METHIWPLLAVSASVWLLWLAVNVPRWWPFLNRRDRADVRDILNRMDSHR